MVTAKRLPQRKQRSLDCTHWVYRWVIADATGRRFITWAPTKKMAQRKAEARGVVVDYVVPSRDDVGMCEMAQLP